MAKCHGEAHHSAKMNPDKVRALRRLRRTVGFSYAQLGKLFSISTRSAYLIDKGYHWKHIKGDDDVEKEQATPAAWRNERPARWARADGHDPRRPAAAHPDPV